jgi:hypothetical protein
LWGGFRRPESKIWISVRDIVNNPLWRVLTGICNQKLDVDWEPLTDLRTIDMNFIIFGVSEFLEVLEWLDSNLRYISFFVSDFLVYHYWYFIYLVRLMDLCTLICWEWLWTYFLDFLSTSKIRQYDTYFVGLSTILSLCSLLMWWWLDAFVGRSVLTDGWYSLWIDIIFDFVCDGSM